MYNTPPSALRSAIVFLTIVLFTACQINPGDAYSRKVNDDRDYETIFLKTNPNSPLPQEDRAAFIMLRYYDPDKSWRLTGNWQLLDSLELVEIRMNDGRDIPIFKAGTVSFQKDGRDFSLTAYQKPEEIPYDSTHLWIPFADSTTGYETFEGGRQLLLHFNGSDTLTIDFNYASNPYSAYSERYRVPLTPKHNFLPIAVEAGEKKYVE